MPEEHLYSKCGKLYIFGKRKTSAFQKYIVFHGYFKDIHLAVFSISTIFPKFLRTLVPFSLVRNNMGKTQQISKPDRRTDILMDLQRVIEYQLHPGHLATYCPKYQSDTTLLLPIQSNYLKIDKKHLIIMCYNYLHYLHRYADKDFEGTLLGAKGTDSDPTLVVNFLCPACLHGNAWVSNTVETQCRGGPTRGARGARAPPVVGRCPS